MCQFELLIIITSNDDIQPSTVVSNQLPSGFVLVILIIHGHIKTHDSESRGQEEAGHTRRMSVLFTGNTAMKFVNALNKPP